MNLMNGAICAAFFVLARHGECAGHRGTDGLLYYQVLDPNRVGTSARFQSQIRKSNLKLIGIWVDKNKNRSAYCDLKAFTEVEFYQQQERLRRLIQNPLTDRYFKHQINDETKMPLVCWHLLFHWTREYFKDCSATNVRPLPKWMPSKKSQKSLTMHGNYFDSTATICLKTTPQWISLRRYHIRFQMMPHPRKRFPF